MFYTIIVHRKIPIEMKQLAEKLAFLLFDLSLVLIGPQVTWSDPGLSLVDPPCWEGVGGGGGLGGGGGVPFL